MSYNRKNFNTTIKAEHTLRVLANFKKHSKKQIEWAMKEIGHAVVAKALPWTPGPGLSLSRTGYKPTGALRRSVRSRMRGWKTVEIIAGGKGSPAPYAFWVHEGLGGNRRAGPRPFLWHGYRDALKEDIPDIIKDALDEAFKD
jgi:hypothetical protein